MAGPTPRLTDQEGMLLSLVLRAQPITAYQIGKIYEASPVSNFNTRKGKIYPLVERMTSKGYLKSVHIAEDRRGTGRLTCTPLGKKALRDWVQEIRAPDVLIEDPLRTKIQCFDLLSHEEQVEWVFAAKAMMEQKRREVDEYTGTVDIPFASFVHDNAISSLAARTGWLDRVLRQLLLGEGSAAENAPPPSSNRE